MECLIVNRRAGIRGRLNSPSNVFYLCTAVVIWTSTWPIEWHASNVLRLPTKGIHLLSDIFLSHAFAAA